MNEDEYLKVRLEDQLNWYSKKSQYNQKRFKYGVSKSAFVLIQFLGLFNVPYDPTRQAFQSISIGPETEQRKWPQKRVLRHPSLNT